MNKQIEEMAEALAYSFQEYLDTDGCAYPDFVKTAKNLYAMGHRKASDVAREIMREVRQALLNMVLANSMGETYDIEKRFAEIEKKYESEGADDE